MRILYCKTFGLGNAICAVPALKALRELYGEDIVIDVLIGSGPDDGGADMVFNNLKLWTKIIDNVYTDVMDCRQYDLAILAIPYDGRWNNRIHLIADRVVDGRTRPDPTTTGFVSWKKHEVEYQMDNVRDLGYSGSTPSTQFLFPTWAGQFYFPDSVYLGLGYKKDAAGFWAQKHWGNENYAKLIETMLINDESLMISTSGDSADQRLTIWPIEKLLPPAIKHRFIAQSIPLAHVPGLAGICQTYIGNDTGTAHIAASFNRPCVVLFKMENAWTKSHPWCDKYEIVKGHDHEVTVDEMYQAFRRIHYGENR